MATDSSQDLRVMNIAFRLHIVLDVRRLNPWMEMFTSQSSTVCSSRQLSQSDKAAGSDPGAGNESCIVRSTELVVKDSDAELGTKTECVATRMADSTCRLE